MNTSTRSLWIAAPRFDLVLFVATPLLIVPIMLAAQISWNVEQISLCVLAFGSLGHHLPGMIRAYGDRDLFARFKTRFIVAPIFLIAVCGVSVYHNLSALILVSVIWGIWHALMQTYGFARIYDARVGSHSRRTANLDFALCVTWFIASIALSTDRMAMMLNLFHESGGPALPPWAVSTSRIAWAGLTGLVTIGYSINLMVESRRGNPPSPIKLTLLVMSIAFYFFVNILLNNLLLGLAMFELFHDVQYLAIVWLFNKNRAKSDRAGRFLKFLFGNSGMIAGLYVGCVVAYGSLRFIEQGLLEAGRFRDGLTALLAASGLLHFYYDGFIWKVREADTRRNLGVNTGEGGSIEAVKSAVRPMPTVGSIGHALKWLGFVVPVVVLSVAQLNHSASEEDRLRMILAELPEHADSRNQFAFRLHEQGQIAEAERQYRYALLTEPDSLDANLNLGALLAQRGDSKGAERHYRKVLSAAPAHIQARINLANVLSAAGDVAEAERLLREVLSRAPESFSVLNNLALVLAQSNRLDEAESYLRMAIKQQPENSTGWYNLGRVAAQAKKFAEAADAYEHCLSLDPDNVSALNNMAAVAIHLGRPKEAQSTYEHVLKLDPTHDGARKNLNRLRKQIKLGEI